MSKTLILHHLKVAHGYWEKLLNPGDCVIDATCGNGQDTLKLCELVLTPEKGNVYAFDIQEQALTATRILLQNKLHEELLKRVIYIKDCHSHLKRAIPNKLEAVKLIVYNLGYLPKGDKTRTTLVHTTLQSIQAATELVVQGGAISIMCYPGHPEGALEESALLEWAVTLPWNQWNCCHHCWINKKNSPSLLLLQKK